MDATVRGATMVDNNDCDPHVSTSVPPSLLVRIGFLLRPYSMHLLHYAIIVNSLIFLEKNSAQSIVFA